MAINVLISLRHVGVETLSKSNRTEIKSLILSQVDEIKIGSPRDLIMVSTVLSLVTEVSDELSKDTQEKAMGMLRELTKELQVFRDQKDLSQAIYINIAEGNIVSAITRAMEARTGESPGSTNSTNSTRDAQKNSFEGVMEQVDSVVLGILSDMVAGEDLVTVELGEVAVLASKVTPDGLNDMQIGKGDAGIAMPPGNEIAKLAGQSPVNVMMKSFGSNPYSWDDSANDVTSGVVSFDIQGVSVSGLSNPISIAMPLTVKPSIPTPTNGTSHYFMKPGNIHVHIISIEKSGTSVFVTIPPEDVSVSFELLLKFGKRPKVDDYDKKFHLPDLSTCRSKELKASAVNCSSDPFTVFLGEDVINRTGLYYVGVLRSVNKTLGLKRSRRSCFDHGRQKRACVEDKDPPPTVATVVNRTVVPQYDPRTDVNYTINIDKQNCLYWSDANQMWTAEGCKAGTGTTGKSLQCLCNHLTSFGGGLVVAPNPIDFDKVFMALSQLSVTGNIAVLATIVCIFLLYIVAAVIARRADKRDQQKTGPPIWLMADEDSNASTYDVIISTGINPNSGTTAKITMVIHGCLGNSDPFTIQNDMETHRILLARGNVDTFVISTPNSLGNLKYINIRHNNFGESPDWFLDYILVRERESREEWRFTSYKWLAIDQDDCRIERNIRCEKQLPNGNFQSVFRSRASNSLYDGHLWLSAITKRPGSSFSRVQRVTCCVCIALSAMLANAMFYNVDGKEEETIRIGPLKISLRQIIVGFQSCLVVAPINIFIIWLFQNSKRSRSRKRSAKYDKKSKQEREEGSEQRLPHFCAYIAWFLCFGTIMTSATFTFFYSLMWGKEKANEWLTCMLLSLTQDIMAVQPVKVVATAFVVAFALTKAKDKISKPRKENKEEFSGEGMDKDQDLVYDKDAPDASELEWFKEEKRKRLRFYAVVREITVFIVFLVVLMAVCFGNTDHNRYLLYKSVRDDFRGIESQASNTDNYWLWLKTTFVPNVYAGKWYNGEVEETEEFIANKRSMIIGMPRLRQLRSKKVPCKLPIVDMASCYSFYSSDQEYKVPMNLLHWVPLPENTSWPQALTMCPKPWRYVSSKELGTLPIVGVQAMYDGGGYVAKLGYEEKTASRVLNELVPNGWIDRQTRAVILEFTVFNTNLNLAAAVSYFYEVLPTGGSTVYTRIETLSLFSTEEGAYEFVLMCQLVFIMMVVGYLVVEGLKCYRQRKEYFLQIWNWLQLCLIVSAVLVVALDFIRQKETLKPVKEVQKNPFATVSFHRALLWSEAQNVAMSAVLFLATVKVLNLIRFNSHVILLSWLLKVAGKYLFSFFILLVILQMAFVSAGMYIFGKTSDMFVSVPRGIVSQLQFILGKAVPLANLQPQSTILATLYAYMYMFTMTMVFINMFVVILNESFEDVKEREDEIAEEKEMADFINTHVSLAIRGAFQKRKTEIRFFVEEFDPETQLNELSDKIDEIRERIDRLE